jgi:hypothetical protein
MLLSPLHVIHDTEISLIPCKLTITPTKNPILMVNFQFYNVTCKFSSNNYWKNKALHVFAHYLHKPWGIKAPGSCDAPHPLVNGNTP